MKHFHKAKEEIRRVTLSSAEKRSMLKRILNAPAGQAEHEPVQSPWTVFSFSSWVMSHKISASVITALLVIILAGGGVSLAANNALPGSALYAVKTRVIEPVRIALASTPAERAAIQSQLATNRLSEAETLAMQGQLDAPKQQEISNLLNESAANLSSDINQVRQTSPDQADDISVAFKASMNAHARILDALAANEAASQGSVSATAPAVSILEAGTSSPAASSITVASSARALASEIGGVQVFKTAGVAVVPATGTPASRPFRAAGVAPTQGTSGMATSAAQGTTTVVGTTTQATTTQSTSTKSQAAQNESWRARFEERRRSVQSLIQTASTSASTATVTTPIQRQIIDQARDAVNQATQSLNQADQASSSSSDSSDSALLQSQTSAEEARILLNAGSRFTHGGGKDRSNSGQGKGQDQ